MHSVFFWLHMMKGRCDYGDCFPLSWNSQYSKFASSYLSWLMVSFPFILFALSCISNDEMLNFSLMAQQGDWIPPPPSNDVLDVLNLDTVHPFQFPPHKRHQNRPPADGPGYSSTERDRYLNPLSKMQIRVRRNSDRMVNLNALQIAYKVYVCSRGNLSYKRTCPITDPI